MGPFYYYTEGTRAWDQNGLTACPPVSRPCWYYRIDYLATQEPFLCWSFKCFLVDVVSRVAVVKVVLHRVNVCFISWLAITAKCIALTPFWQIANAFFYNANPPFDIWLTIQWCWSVHFSLSIIFLVTELRWYSSMNMYNRSCKGRRWRWWQYGWLSQRWDFKRANFEKQYSTKVASWFLHEFQSLKHE